MRKIIFILPCFIFLLGCASPDISYEELDQAEELIISPGEEREKHYKGQQLKDYLSTFRRQKPTLTLVHNAQKGEIKINGYWYPVQYSEVKEANRPAIMTIVVGEKYIRIRQVINKKNYRIFYRRTDNSDVKEKFNINELHQKEKSR